MAVKIDNRQFEQELEKIGAYSFSKGYQDRKGPKRDKYGMLPIEIDATEKYKHFKKKTRKCYNCEKVGHLAKNCRNKKQVNATQKDKRKKKKSQKKEKELNATQIKEKPDHATLSWTACYNDSCLIYKKSKDQNDFLDQKDSYVLLTTMGRSFKNTFNNALTRYRSRWKNLKCNVHHRAKPR